jgi:hypothetical protein
MEFLLKINMDDAAFERMPEWEIDSILKRIAQRIEAGEVYGKTLDTNGNTCGFWGFVEQDELVEAAINIVDTYHALTEEDSVLGLSLDDFRGIYEAFGTAAERCQKAVAKEIARQVGVGL